MRDQRGLGLTELMVALGLIALVFGAAAVALQAGLLTMQAGTGKTETQSNARNAIQRMVWDIREAGYDPTGSNFSAVVNQAASAITVQSDRDASGAVVALPSGACDPGAPSEVVRYRLVGTELRRSVNPAADECEAVLVGGMQTLTLSYFDGAGNATNDSASIRTVEVLVKLVPEDPSASQSTAVLMKDRIRLRNR